MLIVYAAWCTNIVKSHRPQGIAHVQSCELTGQSWEADIEVDAQEVPLPTPIHHHAGLGLSCQI